MKHRVRNVLKDRHLRKGNIEWRSYQRLLGANMNHVGVDVSHWQGLMNWAKAKENGVEFAMIKGTQGTKIFDSQFNNNWTNTRTIYLPRGPYHWYEPELDPIAQAVHFTGKCPEVGELPHCLDVEDSYNIPSDYAVRLKSCLDEITALMGILPMIYTRASYWRIYLKKALDWAHIYPLWAAHYKEDLGPTICLPWTPGTWSLWQFTSSGPGKKYGAASLEIDMDISNGEIPRVVTVSNIERIMIKNIANSGLYLKPTWRDYLIEAKYKLHKLPKRGIPEHET